ncbi:heparinase II/III family protein [Glutamicibacter arilaitensis]|uniref:heparinase II/III domain-containing protein n=1 Tax=Glutamicibacter arilaitensis TaxID=256701 RepID=UPI00384C20E9
MDNSTISRWSDASSKRCAVKNTNGHPQITLPNGVPFEIHDEFFPVDWNMEFSKDKAAARLWFRSLTYLPTVVTTQGDWLVTERVLADFLDFIEKGFLNPAVIRMPSLDHALAIQIRVCCELYLRAKSQELQAKTIISLIDKILPILLELARKPRMRLNNNHGIMVSLALLQVAVFFPHLVPQVQAENDLVVTLEQLGTIIDEDGLSYENTPTYQGLFVRLLQDFTELSSMDPRLVVASEKYSLILGRVSTAYRRLLLPSGHVPPLGDGGLGREIDLLPLTGKFVSTDNGIYVNSNPDSYLSIICGARSAVHKQMDDTSFLLSHNEKLVVLDAGVYNYDPDNDIGAAIRTQRGHSGLYFPKFDLEPLSFFNNGGSPRRVVADMEYVESDGRDSIQCEYILDGFRARRTFNVLSPTSFSLIDRCWAPDGSSGVSRFLLSDDMVLTFCNGLVEGSDNTNWIRIRVQPESKISIKRGVVSHSLKQRENCWVIENPVNPGGRPSIIEIEVGSNL